MGGIRARMLWHSHENCKKATIPKRNRAFWLEKFTQNRKRDAKRVQELRKMGYRVLVFWECELEDEDRLRRKIACLLPDQNPSGEG